MFWENFYKACTDKGYKPSPFLVENGISKGNITKWKNDGALPSGEILIKIAKKLNVSTDYLLGLSEEKALTYNESFTTEEKELVYAYRLHPEMHEAIKKILGIAEHKNSISNTAGIAAYGNPEIQIGKKKAKTSDSL